MLLSNILTKVMYVWYEKRGVKDNDRLLFLLNK